MPQPKDVGAGRPKWFFDKQRGLLATEELRRKPTGAFLIRATDNPASYVLVYNCDGRILHEFILSGSSAEGNGVVVCIVHRRDPPRRASGALARAVL